ncbi:MAG: twin-arginine translocation signal domain-containing protein, partial [PS1 clade bacterium]
MDKTLNRRDFIKTSTAVVGVTTVASGITLTTFAANKDPVTNTKRWGMLIDTNRLSEPEIDVMVSACKKEHGWG